MTGHIEEAIRGIEAERAKLDAAILTLRSLLPTVTLPAPKAAPKVVKAAKAPRKQPLANGSRAERAAEIQRRLVAGEGIKEIAKAVGVTDSAVYLHRKKMGKVKPSPKADGVPTYRCQQCGQRGHDPKRCDHCQEKR